MKIRAFIPAVYDSSDIFSGSQSGCLDVDSHDNFKRLEIVD
ncbi:hypothetical protein [Uliginosibacterium gangwonense]|nr:hypothetical protein [Uliginosibacterium gangwonense]